MTPFTISRVSSFCRWYCRLSISPRLTWITLPTYRSVMANRCSQPQGLATLEPSAGRSGNLAYSEAILERGQQAVDSLPAGRFTVDPDQRLGSAEPDQHPAAVGEVILEAVVGAATLDALAGQLLGRGLLQVRVDCRPAGPVLLALEMDVVAGVGMRPHQVLQVLEHLGQGLAVLDDQVGDEDPGENPVAFRDVAAEAEPSALLAAQNGVHLGHLGPDVLEAHRELMDCDAEPFAQLVHHRGHRQRAHHVPLPATLLDQVQHQQ